VHFFAANIAGLEGSWEDYTIDLLVDPVLWDYFDRKEAKVLLQVSCKEQHEQYCVRSVHMVRFLLL